VARWVYHLAGKRADAQFEVADVRAQVALSLFTDFQNFSVFTPQRIRRKR
jgi:hypothetical protein